MTIALGTNHRAEQLSQASRRVRDGMLLGLIAPIVVGVLTVASSALSEVLFWVAFLAGLLLVVAGLSSLENQARSHRLAGWWEGAVALWIASAALVVLGQALEAAGLTEAAVMPNSATLGEPTEAGAGGLWLTIHAATSAAGALAVLATSRLLLGLVTGSTQLQRTWQLSFDLVRWLLLPGTALTVASMGWLQMGDDLEGTPLPMMGLAGLMMLLSLAMLVANIHVVISMHRTASHAAKDVGPAGKPGLHQPHSAAPTFDTALEGIEAPHRGQAGRPDR